MKTHQLITFRFLLSSLLFIFSQSLAYGQKTDTIRFFSKAFKQERTIYIQTPEFYKYQSDSVKLPVFYILDGQHDWFVNPALSSIRYLQYTHEIPQAIVVMIPHKNRNRECGIVSLDQPEAPLHAMITTEINQFIEPYHPLDYRVLIGHSFSASFAMYSYMLAPNFYSGIIANSPLDQLENLIKALQQDKKIDKSRIYMSFGATDKDFYHRKAYEDMKTKYPIFFNQVHSFLLNSSGHAAMPIIAIPQSLSDLFYTFSTRYHHIAEVDENYKLVNPPKPAGQELAQIWLASKLNGTFYPPELHEINGMASKYNQSRYTEQALGIYELGLKLYPKFFEFPYELAHIYSGTDKQKAKMYLNKTIELLKAIPDKNEKEIMADKKDFKAKNGF